MAGVVGGRKMADNECAGSNRKVCDICKDDNNEEEAVGLCVACNQYLCGMCKQYHRRIATTRDHTIVGINEPAPTPAADEASSSEEIILPTCDTHRGLLLEHYCEHHDKAFCNTCKIVDHRKCTNIQPLREIAAKKSNECAELLDYTKFIEACFEKLKSAKKTEKAELLAEKTIITDKIKEKRKELDRLEHKALAEMEELFNKESKDVDQDIEVIEHSQPLIFATIMQIENSIKTGTAEEKFLECQSATKDVRKYEDIFNDTSSVATRTLHFKENEILASVETLGEISMTKEDVKTDIDFIEENVFVIDNKSKTSESFTTAMHVLSDGRKFLLDAGDKKIKLFNAKNYCVSELDLPGSAISMVAISDNVILIGSPNMETKSLQKINIAGNSMVLDTCIPTKMVQGLVTKYSACTFLAVAKDDAGDYYTQIIDYSGTVKKSSKLDKQLFDQPCFIATCPDNNRDLVYIVDATKGCFGVTPGGEKVFHYEEKDYNAYSGMVVDEFGFIYIGYGKDNSGDLEHGNIVKLSPNGEKVKKLFHHDRKYGNVLLACTKNKLYFNTTYKHDDYTGNVNHVYFKLL